MIQSKHILYKERTKTNYCAICNLIHNSFKTSQVILPGPFLPQLSDWYFPSVTGYLKTIKKRRKKDIKRTKKRQKNSKTKRQNDGIEDRNEKKKRKTKRKENARDTYHHHYLLALSKSSFACSSSRM